MPIPLNPTREQFNGYVTNIIDTYNRSTPEQKAKGRAWYSVARDIAETISGDVETGAGVIAAMSSRTSWEDNVNRATRACVSGKATGHTKDTLRKAQRILEGEHPTEVLPMNSKTGHFYRCIVDPDNTDSVVIDRHAHDVAVGYRNGGSNDRGLSSSKRYESLARAYREASEVLGVTPATVQATTWVVQVDSYRYARSQ